MTITGYTYKASIYCPSCLENKANQGAVCDLPIENILDDLADAKGIDRMNESSIDSNYFPKVILSTDDDNMVCNECGDELS